MSIINQYRQRYEAAKEAGAFDGSFTEYLTERLNVLELTLIDKNTKPTVPRLLPGNDAMNLLVELQAIVNAHSEDEHPADMIRSLMKWYHLRNHEALCRFDTFLQEQGYSEVSGLSHFKGENE